MKLTNDSIRKAVRAIMIDIDYNYSDADCNVIAAGINKVLTTIC